MGHGDMQGLDSSSPALSRVFGVDQVTSIHRPRERAHPDLNQGPADLQSAALTTELCTHLVGRAAAHMDLAH